MKKMLAILTAAMLLLVCGGALADTVKFFEDSSDFDIEMELPDGASVGDRTSSELVSTCEINSDGLASVTISIAMDDMYGDLSLNDLSDEEVAALAEAAAEPYVDPETSVEISPSGNGYVALNADEEGISVIVTVYLGYFVQLTQYHDDFSEITEADNEFLLQLLHNIEFLPV